MATPARRVDPTEASKLLAITRSVAEDARRLQVQLTAARSERDDAQRARDSLAQEAQRLRQQLATAQSELATSQKAQASSAEELEVLRSNIVAYQSECAAQAAAASVESTLRSQLNVALRQRSALAEDAEVLRGQLRTAEGQLDAVSRSFPICAREDLEVAWESFVGEHVNRLQVAFANAGVRTFGVERLVPSRKSEENKLRSSGRPARTPGLRESTSMHATKHPAPVLDVESDGSSQDVRDTNDPVRLQPQRAVRRSSVSGPAIPGPSRARHQRKARRVCFAHGELLASQVSIVNYRECSEALWYDNPQTKVACGLCEGRFPQQHGSLHGPPGRSGFMCDEFLCIGCSGRKESVL